MYNIQLKIVIFINKHLHIYFKLIRSEFGGILMDFEEEIREELEREDKEEDVYAEEDEVEDDEDVSSLEEGFMKGYEEDLDLEKEKDDDY